ncbi:esterase-like activity of phytase family protein [Conservatibacter flavescens]|uniref:Alkaline phosphatase n=1 Tax=Conservatibacter flavescens TaxID=28161 RepID=A0A2M8S4D5_9PAST|nr:esterase-like activity of phytase family protein [Conservatibacter flavescens]PJG86005.1 alkaline phosphatase [Conservatibacter flavescens]
MLFKIKALSLSLLTAFSIPAAFANNTHYFNRSASFLVCSQLDKNCHTDIETSAEILYADKSGKTLVYTDSPAKQIGFVDITNLHEPQGKKVVKINGEPTSVAIKDRFALVGVNTSKDYVNTSGELQIYHLDSFELVASLDLGGQPDSVAISPDGQFAAIAIENERDEDKNKGALPQMPAGYLMIVDTQSDNPKDWTLRKVALTGLSGISPEDPEPEYVSINENNVAAVTLQENNAIALIDLAKGEVLNHFSAGEVNLTQIDASEKKPLKIQLNDKLDKIPREPDGVVWLDTEHFATANEGDWKGGSRGFSIFNTQGKVIWDSGNALEHLAVKFGHYPEKRSENKGNEPENIAFGIFGDEKLLFINSERASLVFVYNVNDPTNPQFKQALPTGVAPEGAFVIPERNALVVAAEADSREDQIRSTISIYEYHNQAPNYPTLQSVEDSGLPIAWGALSGLAADKKEANILYSIEDSFYGHNRIFVIDVASKPAQIIHTISIKDTQGLLSKTFPEQKKLVNEDRSVNIDPEGIATDNDGNLWIASEGAGTVGDKKRPVSTHNFLLKLNKAGEILQVITLPETVNNMQVRFGFEGVAVENNKVYVAFQAPWGDEKHPRLGIYDLGKQDWEFVYYPLDPVESQAGGWVGVSDLSPQGNGIFWVLERDNRAGPDAAIKRIYEINLSEFKPNSVLTKKLVRDLMPDLAKANGLIPEKIEGLTTTQDGRVFIVNDNDGVDDNNGETQLIEIMKK